MPPITKWWHFIRTRTFEDDWANHGLGDEDLSVSRTYSFTIPRRVT
jgi:hypothetical protein